MASLLKVKAWHWPVGHSRTPQIYKSKISGSGPYARTSLLAERALNRHAFLIDLFGSTIVSEEQCASWPNDFALGIAAPKIVSVWTVYQSNDHLCVCVCVSICGNACILPNHQAQARFTSKHSLQAFLSYRPKEVTRV